MNLSPRAKQLLALQQAKYLRSLPEKKARLANAWNATRQQGWTPESSEVLKTEVHRLSGSAGSYGLHSLGKAAQNLDSLLADSTKFVTPSADLEAEFEKLMDVLFQVLDEDIDGCSERSNLDSEL